MTFDKMMVSLLSGVTYSTDIVIRARWCVACAEKYETRLGLDAALEPNLRVLDQPGKQWRGLVKRIASQLVDAAELNRVARVE
jgi:hypothetical protein